MTIRALLPLLAATMSLTMFAGCNSCEGVAPPNTPDAGPQADCLVDGDCDDGWLCMAGFCTVDATACIGNADCDDGDVCRDGQCTDRDASGDCNGNEACAATELCTTTLPGAAADCLVSAACAAAEPGTACDDDCWGFCVSRPACANDDDCEITEQCDPVANVCVPIGDCDVDADCPATASCLDGVCTDNGSCVVDEECADTESCIDGDCTRNGDCEVDSDCPADQRCGDADVCERRDPCTTNEQCAVDEICELDNDGGTCVVIGDCDTVEDCPTDPSIACLEGVCTRAECGRDSDCDDGLFCNGAETCNPRIGCDAGTAPTTANLPSCADEVCDEANDVVVVTPFDNRCGDNSPCTDDICDLNLGCTNPENTFVPAPGPVGDCVQAVCLGGQVRVIEANSETPSDIGTADDCRVAVCRAGSRALDVNDSETPPQRLTDDCVKSVCQEGAAVVVAADLEVPPQASAIDCQKEICSNMIAVSVADNSEALAQTSASDCRTNQCVNGAPGTVANDSEALAQTSSSDCVTNQCVNGAPTTVADNTEVPAQASAVDCQRESCVDKAVVRVADNSEVLAQTSTTDCVTNQCVNGATGTVPANETLAQTSTSDCVTNQCVNGTPSTVANDAEIPSQTSAVDCQRDTCVNKAVVRVADNTEVLAQTSSTDCRTNQCVNGAPSTVANNAEVLAQSSASDCKTNQCVTGAPGTVANNAEIPAQTTSGDCQRQSCSNQVVVTVVDNNDVPADSGCREGTCTAGTPSTVPSDDNCNGIDVCLADGTCRTPATLTCGIDDGVRTRLVLQRFELFATAANTRSGTTFVWDVAGVPTGGDASAQILTNPTSQNAAFFQATSPSVSGFDYALRVTMNEPGLPLQACQVTVHADPLPDTLQVTVFMANNLDVDVHLTGGVGSKLQDMRFHTDHLAQGTESRSCYWSNCAICTASVPGQGCTVTGPSVDFSTPRNTASYSDPNDPQLDIDNVRGCFTGTNGDLSCIPEKITVEAPPAGTYFAWAYLWGAAQALNEGSLSSPAATVARLEIDCRGTKTSISRTLRSDTANNSGVAAGSRDPRRYGGSAGQIKIVVPTAANAPCVITDGGT